MRIFGNYERPELLSLSQKGGGGRKARRREGEEGEEREEGEKGRKKERQVSEWEGGWGSGEEGGKENTYNNKKADLKDLSPNKNYNIAILIFIPHHRQHFWNVLGYSTSVQGQQLNKNENTSPVQG